MVIPPPPGQKKKKIPYWIVLLIIIEGEKGRRRKKDRSCLNLKVLIFFLAVQVVKLLREAYDRVKALLKKVWRHILLSVLNLICYWV